MFVHTALKSFIPVKRSHHNSTLQHIGLARVTMAPFSLELMFCVVTIQYRHLLVNCNFYPFVWFPIVSISARVISWWRMTRQRPGRGKQEKLSGPDHIKYVITPVLATWPYYISILVFPANSIPRSNTIRAGDARTGSVCFCEVWTREAPWNVDSQTSLPWIVHTPRSVSLASPAKLKDDTGWKKIPRPKKQCRDNAKGWISWKRQKNISAVKPWRNALLRYPVPLVRLWTRLLPTNRWSLEGSSGNMVDQSPFRVARRRSYGQKVLESDVLHNDRNS